VLFQEPRFANSSSQSVVVVAKHARADAEDCKSTRNKESSGCADNVEDSPVPISTMSWNARLKDKKKAGQNNRDAIGGIFFHCPSNIKVVPDADYPQQLLMHQVTTPHSSPMSRETI
jgi:hypothetical protein